MRTEMERIIVHKSRIRFLQPIVCGIVIRFDGITLLALLLLGLTITDPGKTQGATYFE